ncbi:hypothetical protein HS125_04985 [bacterium]|nr:hypothetical protein [bacterium]
MHRISLYNEHGEIIDPRSDPAEPYSTNRTCGKCHDYAAISTGWHFNAGRAGVAAGRPGEPHVLYDARTQTWLPVSYRPWPGVFSPADAGMEAWEFTLTFGRHRPGGGVMEPPGEPEPGTRWNFSGKLEIDCLVCHSGDNSHDPIERARQIGEDQNLKWSHTVAAGLGVTRGAAKTMPDDYDPLLGPNPDHPEWSGPTLLYDRGRFNPDNRVYLNITKSPGPDRCLFCHTTSVVEPDPVHPYDTDVHLAAGLTCTDCHRNGINHMITRGDGSAEDLQNNPANATLSCRGCHLGENGRIAGRLGAPRPRHAALPEFHLEELTCTACHSGPWPRGEAARIQTSLAHGLGLTTEEDRRLQPPAVVAPVFMKNPSGEIAPHKLFWPAYWAREENGRFAPIAPQAVLKAAREHLPAPPAKDATALPELTDAMILNVLAALTKSPGDRVAYVRGGLAYERTLVDGSPALVGRPDADLQPVAWPLGHNVRSAGLALGAGGCSDCHAGDSGFFYGKVSADRAAAPVMHELMGLLAWTIPLGNLAVWAREGVVARAVALGTLGTILAALLHFAFLRRHIRRAAPVAPEGGWPVAWLRWAGLAGLYALALTGVGFMLNYGYWRPGFFAEHSAVELHLAAGIVFGAATVLLGLAWLFNRQSPRWKGADGLLWRLSARPSRLPWPAIDLVIFWTLVVSGTTLALRPETMPGWLSIAYALHGVAALAALGRLAWYVYLRRLAETPHRPQGA